MKKKKGICASFGVKHLTQTVQVTATVGDEYLFNMKKAFIKFVGEETWHPQGSILLWHIIRRSVAAYHCHTQCQSHSRHLIT